VERTGVVYPTVLLPDLLLLAEMAAVGQLKEVQQPLWLTRAKPSQAAPARLRQRATLFAGRAPARAWLPWPLVHAGVLVWALAVRGNGVLPRREGLGVARAHLGLYRYVVFWVLWRRRFGPSLERMRKRRHEAEKRMRKARRRMRKARRRMRKARRRVTKAVRRVTKAVRR
jgi:hypothetical protein